MEGEDVKFVCSAVARSHPDFHLLKWKQPSNVSNGTDPFDFVDFTKSKYQEIRETAKQHTGNRKLYTHRFIVRNVTLADEARYTCMVGNSAGYVSHNVFLTIKTHDGRFCFCYLYHFTSVIGIRLNEYWKITTFIPGNLFLHLKSTFGAIYRNSPPKYHVRHYSMFPFVALFFVIWLKTNICKNHY